MSNFRGNFEGICKAILKEIEQYTIIKIKLLAVIAFLEISYPNGFWTVVI